MLELNYKCVQCSYRFRYVLKPTFAICHAEDNLTLDSLVEEILPEGEDIPEGYETHQYVTRHCFLCPKELTCFVRNEYIEDICDNYLFLCKNCKIKCTNKGISLILHSCYSDIYFMDKQHLSIPSILEDISEENARKLHRETDC